MTLSQLIGGKHQITIGEEVVTFSPVTLAMEAEFERRLLAKTKNSLAVMREIVTPEEFLALVKSINDAYALGQYKLVGKNGFESLKTLDGLLILGSLVTGLPEDKVKSYIKTHGVEFGQTLTLTLKESIGELTGG